MEEQAFIDICDELGCAYDNESPLIAIDNLKHRARVPDGYVLVPRKITVAMIAAGWSAFRRDKPPVQLLGPGKGFVEAWEAMIDAATLPE